MFNIRRRFPAVLFTVLGILLSYWYVAQFCTSEQTYSWAESCTCCHFMQVYCTTDVVLTATRSCHRHRKFNVTVILLCSPRLLCYVSFCL